MLFPVVQMRKWRHREAKRLAQGPTAGGGGTPLGSGGQEPLPLLSSSEQWACQSLHAFPALPGGRSLEVTTSRSAKGQPPA